MALAAKVFQGVKGKGEQFEINVSVQNEATVDIDNLIIELIESRYWKAGIKDFRNVRPIASFLVLGQALPGSQKAKEKRHIVPGVLQELLMKVASTTTAEHKLSIGQDALETYSSDLISIQHTLKVTLQTVTCVTNPTVSTNVVVQAASSTSSATTGLGSSSYPVIAAPAFAPITTAFAPGFATPTSSPPAVPVVQAWQPAYTPADYAQPQYYPQLQFQPQACMYGGLPAVGDGEEGAGEEGNAPSAPPMASMVGQELTLETLSQEMAGSCNDFHLVSRYFAYPSAMFMKQISQLQPHQLATIVKNTEFSLDQAKVAVVVVNKMIEWQGLFTTNHIIAAVRAADALVKTELLDALSPLATDFTSNKEQVSCAIYPIYLCI